MRSIRSIPIVGRAIARLQIERLDQRASRRRALPTPRRNLWRKGVLRLPARRADRDPELRLLCQFGLLLALGLHLLRKVGENSIHFLVHLPLISPIMLYLYGRLFWCGRQDHRRSQFRNTRDTLTRARGLRGPDVIFVCCFMRSVPP